MKRSLMILLVIAMSFNGYIYSQTVYTGSNSSAQLKAGVKFRAFGGDASSKTVYLGDPSFAPFTFTEYIGVIWGAPSTKTIYFTFDGNSTITAKVNGFSTNSYTFSSQLGIINYIELRATTNGAQSKTISLNSIKINGNTFTDNSINSTSGTTKKNITGLTLTSGFNLEGSLTTTGSNFASGDNVNLEIVIGYVAPPDNQAPEVKNILANPTYDVVGTDVVITALIDDIEKGNSNIISSEYSLDNTNWYAMSAADGSFNTPLESVTKTLSNLACGNYTVYVKGTDALNNTSTSVSTTFTLYEEGSISGYVKVGNNGVGGVIVKLLYYDGTEYLNKTTTESAPNVTPGYYEFTGLLPDEYRVQIVTPLGFSVISETQDFTLGICNNDYTADFALTQIPIVNNARGKGYWKHQFDTNIKNKPGYQESSTQLNTYITRIINNYVPHYSLEEIFNSASTDFAYWSSVLSYGGNDMRKKAQAHFAALLFNYASLKISQLEVVTLDGNDVSDVITEASNILSSSTSTFAQLEKAKNICEMVNSQIKIPAGLVSDYNTLYKEGRNGEKIDFNLASNYPNPFNPSTMINFSMPEPGQVTLKVFDVLGKEIAVLIDKQMTAGSHSVNFNAEGLSSGVYVYQIKVNDFISTRKMILNK